MLKSMTGFGKATAELPDKTITVEIKSLNGKYLDLNLRLPSLFREREGELRSEVARRFERGKMEVAISTEYTGGSKNYTVNRDLVKGYLADVQQVEKESGVQSSDPLAIVMRLPDVMMSGRAELSEEEWKTVMQTFDKASEAFHKFRSDEGKKLEEDIVRCVKRIAGLLEEVEKMDPRRMENVRARLKKGIKEVLKEEQIDQNRFEQELIFYVEKLDINEEKTRLRSHCDYFGSTIRENSPGRKLGFIAQEMGREINTIGSKANDADMQKLVVQMKDELEKIREQLNNVL